MNAKGTGFEKKLKQNQVIRTMARIVLLRQRGDMRPYI